MWGLNGRAALIGSSSGNAGQNNRVLFPPRVSILDAVFQRQVCRTEVAVAVLKRKTKDLYSKQRGTNNTDDNLTSDTTSKKK